MNYQLTDMEKSIAKRNAALSYFSEACCTNPSSSLQLFTRTNIPYKHPLNECQTRLYTVFAQHQEQSKNSEKPHPLYKSAPVAIEFPPLGYFEHLVAHYTAQNTSALLFAPKVSSTITTSAYKKHAGKPPIVIAHNLSTQLEYLSLLLNDLPAQSLNETTVHVSEHWGKDGQIPSQIPAHLASICLIPATNSKGANFIRPIVRETIPKSTQFQATYTFGGQGHELLYDTLRKALQSSFFRGWGLTSSYNTVKRTKKRQEFDTKPDSFSLYHTEKATEFHFNFDVYNQAALTAEFILTHPIFSTQKPNRSHGQTSKGLFTLTELIRAEKLVREEQQKQKKSQPLPPAHHGVVDDKLSEFRRVELTTQSRK
jgi:hypothetical protein